MYHDRATDFSAFAGYRAGEVTLRAGDRPERLNVLLVTAGFELTRPTILGSSSALLAAGLLLFARPALAHSVGISRGEYEASGSMVRAKLTFANAELAIVVPRLDVDGNGSASEAELERALPQLGKTIVGGLEVRSATGLCHGRLEETSLTDEDGVAFQMVYRCADAPPLFQLRLGLLATLSLGHRHIAAASSRGAAALTDVLYEARPEFWLTASREAISRGGVAWSLFRLGIQHILTGYDHLLFLFGLILVGGRLRSLLIVVTAFTVAHSVTLGFAALGIWTPSARFVEPAIALSIAYIGIENWFVRDAERRWLVTFPFGLVHGFGFAGALREIALPAGQVPVALASFNVGVEAGQLVVLAIMLPCVLWLGQRNWFAKNGIKATSLGVALAGLYWFAVRLS
jgi:hydrogenase/urease accessory protein HupE